MKDSLPRFLEINEELEKTVGEITLVFGHNDLLAANFIDDGTRLWLVDWDYAGYNSALFDLANLASNNEFSPEQEDWLLGTYSQQSITDSLRRRLAAMKCASLLRETLWSIVSEIHSTLDFDYVGYTEKNLDRFERAFEAFKRMC
jgi:thiamine kinase-like enzyme